MKKTILESLLSLRVELHCNNAKCNEVVYDYKFGIVAVIRALSKEGGAKIVDVAQKQNKYN